MNDKRAILVVGATQICVMAESGVHRSDGDAISVEVGGLGCDMALNLRFLEQSARLLTVLPQHSNFSSVITNYLDRAKVDAMICRDPCLPGRGVEAISSAFIGGDGEVSHQSSCTPYTSYVLPDDRIVRALTGVRGIILDCSAPIEVLERIVGLSHFIPKYLVVSDDADLMKIARMERLGERGVVAIFSERSFRYRRENIALENPAQTFGVRNFTSLYSDGVAVYDFKADEHVWLDMVHQGGRRNRVGQMAALAAGVVALNCRGGHDSPFGRAPTFMESVETSLHMAAESGSRRNSNFGADNAVGSVIGEMSGMAYRDPLTDVLNRAGGVACMERADRAAKEHGAPYHLIIVDLDLFKGINDQWGHDIGDQILKRFSAILEHSVRGHDNIVRWGGDEFVCLINRASADDAMMVACRICDNVRSAEIVAVKHITASIGVSSWEPGLVFNDVLKRADEALYRVKRGGRNNVAKG